MSRRAGAIALVTLLLTLSGAAGPALAGPAEPGPGPGGGPSGPEASVTAATNHTPTDPETDVIGWEAGYWHNESIDVDQSDGLTQAEFDAFVARAMARVEVLREREFKQSVPVEVITRATYREQSGNRTASENFSAWNNQVWEALFIVGEDADVQAELETVRGTAVIGFYSPADDEIKVITETPDEPVLDNATLVHELVHAMQDQYHNLSRPRFRGSTQDTQLAVQGLIEGEANYIERRYAQRCGAEWECVPSPRANPGGSGQTPNLGILLTVFHPYSDGPVFVSSLLVGGGWSAVDTAFEVPTRSTEQIIHTTDEAPVPIRYEDVATAGWSLFPEEGVNGSDTVGEASLFAMFWYQAHEARAATIDPNSLFRGIRGPYDTYNYDVTPSAGWGNDRVFPYRQQLDNETDFGYVWVTEWDTEDDAREFRGAYLRILDAHDADRVGTRTWVVAEGPFADSFRVVLNGTRVTVVNGPTPEALAEIRPDIDFQPLQTPTATPTVTTPPPTAEATATASPTIHTATTPGQPGFGPLLALMGIGGLTLWRYRRR